MIEAKGIVKNYGNLRVLKGVDILIKKGEVVAITGKSGAGKSTLLHILGTLDQSDEGTILFEDNDISKYNNKELAKFRNSEIGFIFQFHYLLPEFTALENVSIPGFISKRPENEVIEEAKKLLDYLGLTDRMQHKPGALSGGEQQRVSVARALINKPSVIFADEPSGNLDIQSSQELHSLIFKLRNDFNQTFVLVTHNTDLAKMSDRCLEMRDGQILV
ncbi:MAG: ABC transporter ATP-binding protein [Saprospiraceae bacterium]|nr:ABC transporter ATP-binding protein [Saprospiraceae bacterium]MDP4915410.1 ABC transporter ATP-binding protein [Saprospiraceae bacterium]MDP5049540.1 ABC transporter ATP-binding protein [Saprospiraceae bacterium]MDP5089621.1 ABC transporter ATP-binding protein [Saprospiraceae bacterium]